jgi:flagellar biosynthesis protein FlhB
MAEGSTPEERTELPTDRRMSQLRKEGQVHMSNEVVQVATLITGFTALCFIVNNMFGHMKLVLVRTLKSIGEGHALSYPELEKHIFGIMQLIAPDLAILCLTVAIVASLAVMLQTNWCVKEKKIKFDFGKMNPIAGVKNMFSISGTVNTLKALVKLSIILPMAYYSLKAVAPQMIGLIHLSIPEVMSFTGESIHQLFWKILYVLIAMAIFDYFWGKYQWLRNNKMTKQEVKDERKSIEGDEETRRKIVAKGLQRIIQRLKQTVPQADVVVTNPTHFAVALKYERGKMRAPVVVAKGADFLAQRIKEIAREHHVPVLERKTLARALYSSTEIGTEIPYDLFKAVAEVLAYVYRLKNPYAYQASQAPAGNK